MGKICIGIDVGGTSVKLGIFTTDGKLIKKWEIITRKALNSQNVIPDIAKSVRDELAFLEYKLDEVIGIGMGVPGPVLPNGYVEVCVNLGWRDMFPGRELSALLDDIKVELANDANVAALGETWQGGAKGYSDVIMITLGTGVGGGIIIDKKIVAGRHGLGGEIGHIHVRDSEKEYCNCGGRGCLEQIASATGILHEAVTMLKLDASDSLMRKFGDDLTAKDVLDCAKLGDIIAVKVMDTVARYLGVALSYGAMMVDPEVFVIGGGVSKAGQYLVDIIDKYYDYYTPISKNRGKVVLAKLGNDAGIYGAACIVL